MRTVSQTIRLLFHFLGLNQVSSESAIIFVQVTLSANLNSRLPSWGSVFIEVAPFCFWFYTARLRVSTDVEAGHLIVNLKIES